ncbi:hypothetical protein GY45DRAFT_1438965 [Cubamyces sp. BRFM 1775]|nr:hypothetical protein GY45DRAFT_1438965 [Cubamyces sp. BRFM 1775]
MPAELLLLVAEHLDPADILSLYRTNQYLHQLLASKLAKRAWRYALQSLNSPEPPSWLSLPQYAALLCDKHCQKCLRPGPSLKTIWQFGARYCGDCFNQRTLAYDQLQVDGGGDRYHIPHVVQLSSIIMETEESGHPAIYDGWRTNLEATTAHVQQCIAWDEVQERRRLELTLVERKAKLIARIRAAGFLREWNEIGLHPNWLGAILHMPRPLSDYEWGKVRSDVLTFLLERRKMRERMEQRDAISFRLHTLQNALCDMYWHQLECETRDRTVPLPWDLAHLDDIVQLVSLPRAAELPEEVFAELLPKLIPVWKQERTQQIMSLLTGKRCEVALTTSGQGSPASSILTRSMHVAADPLNEPTAIFFCTKCRETVTGTRAMSHVCCYDYSESYLQTLPIEDIDLDQIADIPGDLYENAFRVAYYGRYRWSGETLRSCEDIARTVLLSCGSGSATNSRSSRPYVACGSCSVPGKALLVMRWEVAVLHACQEHADEQSTWIPVSVQVEAKVKSVEFSRCSLTEDEWHRRCNWICDCEGRIPGEIGAALDWDEMVIHLSLCRPGVAPSPLEHCRRSADSPSYMPPPILVVDPAVRVAGVEEIYPAAGSYLNSKRVGCVTLRSG